VQLPQTTGKGEKLRKSITFLLLGALKLLLRYLRIRKYHLKKQ